MSRRIQAWARVLRALAAIAAVCIVAAVIHAALWGDLPADIAATAGLVPEVEVARARIAATTVAGALPAIAVIFVLWRVRTLLALFAEGAVLTDASATAIRSIGAGLLGIAALSVLSGPLVSVIASSGNPLGQRVMALSLDSADLFTALAGSVMLMIGWAMAEAARVASENRAFV